VLKQIEQLTGAGERPLLAARELLDNASDHWLGSGLPVTVQAEHEVREVVH
jgi:hypothetical protein